MLLPVNQMGSTNNDILDRLSIVDKYVQNPSINMENLAHLVSRMSLHEGEEYQLSSHHMLEVPLGAVAFVKVWLITESNNYKG